MSNTNSSEHNKFDDYIKKALQVIHHFKMDDKEPDEFFKIYEPIGKTNNGIFIIKYHGRNYYCQILENRMVSVEPSIFRIESHVDSILFDNISFVLSE